MVVELKQQVSSSSSFSSFSSQRRLEYICNDFHSVSMQVQGCLHHVRALNAKLASGCDPNSKDLKVVYNSASTFDSVRALLVGLCTIER